MKDKKIIEATVHPIFPKPIYKTFLSKPLTKKDIDYAINIEKKDCNVGNTNTTDTYILNRKKFASLKKELTNIAFDYIKKINCPKYNVKPYITQSWFNYTKTNQYHHKHSHDNSFISGVVYFLADPELDNIVFYDEKNSSFSIEPKQYNLFNSNKWIFPVEKNQVILFPSNLVHGVDEDQREGVRLSLAFNVFLKGRLGNTRNLTELIL
jgi:uncharacterized protein (TIGR02466 family)|tara:strand:+ start:856 stop:1482 length:627 start_codon:yes stop_codon:yes gene_type:complete